MQYKQKNEMEKKNATDIRWSTCQIKRSANCEDIFEVEKGQIKIASAH